MKPHNQPYSLEKARLEIGRKVRSLRLARSWSQGELGAHLGLSQSRLSEIERGDGSFSAEQFLLVLRLFNVPASSFIDERTDDRASLQNALARFGATHLYESEQAFPGEDYADLSRAVQDALVDGSARLVTALAPILLRHARQLNLPKLQADLQRLGYERRLPWTIENTLNAVSQLRGRIPNRLASQAASLQLFLDLAQSRVVVGAPDILDPTIRTRRTVFQTERDASDISRRWGIISMLKPSDFVDALKATIVTR